MEERLRNGCSSMPVYAAIMHEGAASLCVPGVSGRCKNVELFQLQRWNGAKFLSSGASLNLSGLNAIKNGMGQLVIEIVLG